MSIFAILKATAPFFSAAATIGSGVMQGRQTEAVNKQMLELAYKQREDTLREQDRLAGMQQQQINMQRQQLGQNRKQQEIENEKFYEQRNYERLQRAGNKFSEYLNQKQSLKNMRMSGFQRR